MTQQGRIYLNKDRFIVQGVYYLGKRRIYRRLASFAEAGLAEDGRPLPGSDAAARDALLDGRWAEQGKQLERKPPKAMLPKGDRMKEALAEWQKAMAPVRSPRTLKIFALMTKEYLAACGDHPVADFTLRHYDRFLAALDEPHNGHRWKHRRNFKLSAVARNMRLKALGAFFTWAKERKLIAERPKIKLLRVHRTLPRVPTADQVEALFRHLWTRAYQWSHRHQQREYRLLLRYYLLARFTGARLQELYWLPWANVNFAEKTIYVLKSARFAVKERKEKPLPMPPPLLGWLETERAAHKDEVYLFDNGKGDVAYHSPYALTQAFHRQWAAEGVDVHGVKPSHTFRAFFAQHLRDENFDVAIIQQWLGHQRIDTTMGYFADPFRRLKEGATVLTGPAELMQPAPLTPSANKEGRKPKRAVLKAKSQ